MHGCGCVLRCLLKYVTEDHLSSEKEVSSGGLVHNG